MICHDDFVRNVSWHLFMNAADGRCEGILFVKATDHEGPMCGGDAMIYVGSQMAVGLSWEACRLRSQDAGPVGFAAEVGRTSH